MERFGRTIIKGHFHIERCGRAAKIFDRDVRSINASDREIDVAVIEEPGIQNQFISLPEMLLKLLNISHGVGCLPCQRSIKP